MRKITLLIASLMMGLFVMNAQDPVVLFEDDFESYDNFIIDNIGEFTLLDQDGANTYGFQGIAFDNSGGAFAYMIFNSTATNPPMDGDPGSSDWSARSGEKALAAFASVGVPNDDWLITPAIGLGTSGNTFTFYAKAADATYGLEYFNVLISTTSATDLSSFTALASNELPPAAVWGEFSYDLDAYAGQTVYLAIQHVGNDQFGFMIDDLSVTAGELSVNKDIAVDFNYFYDKNTGNLNLTAGNELTQIDIYNMLGQKVISSNLSSSEANVDMSSLQSGIYMAKVEILGQVKTFKIAVN